jgi:anti-sigma-K factor RskA
LDCRERKDHILLDAAGVLEPDEQQEIRAHLATGCPQCSGYRAEAEAVIAQLSLAVDPVAPPAGARDRLMQRVNEFQLNQSRLNALGNKATAPSSTGGDGLGPVSYPIRKNRKSDWERIVVASSLAAVLAVAVTLGAVAWLRPKPQVATMPEGDTAKAMQMMLDEQAAILHHDEDVLKHDQQRILELEAATRPTAGLNFAELTGDKQPEARGRVFIDADEKKWYFFTSGMQPAPDGKTYELWVISDNQKLPAGTFQVNADGSATLLGAVPALKPGAAITLAVTDEPAGGVQVPTGSIQIKGTVQ